MFTSKYISSSIALKLLGVIPVNNHILDKASNLLDKGIAVLISQADCHFEHRQAQVSFSCF